MSNLQQQLDRIAAKLASKIDNALANEVADAVREEEAATIKEVVYSVYTPKLYRRRGNLDGFGDPYNIDAEVKDGVLTVKNVTEPNPGGTLNDGAVTTGKSLDKLVEYGHGSVGGSYDFPMRGADFMKPRPFTAETIKRLRKTKKLVHALQKGLKRQKIKTTRNVR